MKNDAAGAAALIAIQRYEEAIPLLQRAITQNPQDPYPRCLLALCLLNIGKPKDAAEMAGTAIALDPHAEWPHRLRSQALTAVGKQRKALHEAEEAVRADPDEAQALFILGERLLYRWWRLKRASEVVRRGLALEPDSYVGHELLGRIELRRRHWKEAEAAYRKALTIRPQSWVLMNNLGIALQRQGRQVEAITMFENAARANPRAKLPQQNLYLGMRRYVGFGLVGTVILFNVFRGAIGLARSNPLSAAMVLLIVTLGMLAWIIVRSRRRAKLSPVATTFYKLEHRRQLRRNGPFVAVWFAGAMAVIVLSLTLFPWLHEGALLLMLGGVVAWLWAWRYLWFRRIGPWLETRF